ncbi:MAG: nickel pincer cofactor biosynthesis protein LarB [Thermoguttaceae bacterium]|nr:nickel pincer cofactor biosynthesis protein LarB [Thermoguttaceae bacterium]
MRRERVEQLARQLLAGEIPLEAFVDQVALPGIADLGEAQVDLDRASRCGFPEVVYAPGKSVEVMEKIFHALLEKQMEVLATRVSPEQASQLLARFPQGRYNQIGQVLRIAPPRPVSQPPAPQGRVVVVTAGTTDLPVAEEVRETALWTGAEVILIQDVGVAGPHRLLAHLDTLRSADCIVVVAGMEGALPSVVGGHVACPVIGVPTSVGYGASFGGVAALLSMLNSCASNVVVVNIDAGFKAGYVAGLIAQNLARARSSALSPTSACSPATTQENCSP